MSKPYKRPDSRFYWIAPVIAGKQCRQSSGETDYERAERKLRILEGKIASNVPMTARTDRDSFAALLELVKTDYKIKRRDSTEDMERRIKLHIDPILGRFPSGKVSSTVLADYILERQREGASDATINRELAIIKRAFRLGIRSGEVSIVPYVEMLPEDNIRTGFFTEEGFRSLLAKSNDLLRDVLTVAYYTGWRIESVVLMEWRNVDLSRGLIGLTRPQTKNRKATAFPLEPFPELRGVLEARQSMTKTLERQKAALIPWVFHRDGFKVRSIRKAFELARDRAGLPGRILHDLRRTAARNLEDLGFSETAIMEMMGLKTRSMFARYNITNEQDILRKGAQIASRLQHSTSTKQG